MNNKYVKPVFYGIILLCILAYTIYLMYDYIYVPSLEIKEEADRICLKSWNSYSASIARDLSNVDRWYVSCYSFTPPLFYVSESELKNENKI